MLHIANEHLHIQWNSLLIHFARWQLKCIIFSILWEKSLNSSSLVCELKNFPNYQNTSSSSSSRKRGKMAIIYFGGSFCCRCHCRCCWWLLISLAFNHDRNCLITWLFKTFAHKLSTFHRGSKEEKNHFI